jgi:SAM-dependent methyltransferase
MPSVARWNETDLVAMGGPPKLFERVGREQLIVLLEHGLDFDSTVVDIGCGALRGGRWVIPLLEPGHYCGVDPNRQQVESGLARFVPPEVVDAKRPRFSFNAEFDLSAFGTTFTHFLLRSVWTHAPKPMIERTLDAFVRWATPDGVMLASLWTPRLVPARGRYRPDYKGTEWVGRDHRSSVHGGVAHSWRWVRAAAAARGLTAAKLRRPPINRQVWVVVRRAGSPAPPAVTSTA